MAYQQYHRVVQLLDGYFKDDEKAKRDPLLLTGHLNMAACHLKLKNNFKCIKECEKVTVRTQFRIQYDLFFIIFSKSQPCQNVLKQ